jgi:pseudouridine kinase
MTLTEREREIVALLRADPMITPAQIAERVASSRAAVNVHLSNLGKKGAILGRGYILREDRAVVVIGGANLDVKARRARSVTPGTSNPGHASMSPGGVGRNIAEALARLGTNTHLICVVGRDPAGERLLADTREAGVHLDHLHRSDGPTGTYTAVLDADGELAVAVSDMTATQELRPEHVTGARDLIGNADLLLLDGNLPADTVAAALDLGHAAGVRCVLEPVSVPKSAALAALIQADRPLFAITPNRDELQAITGLPAGTEPQLLAAVSSLHDRGVHHVWVRLGAHGSLFSTAGEGHQLIAAWPVEVVDVTGAGDAMLAAFAHALLTGHEPAVAARHGHAAAALTIQSTHTVRPDLTPRLIQDVLQQQAQDTQETQHIPEGTKTP